MSTENTSHIWNNYVYSNNSPNTWLQNYNIVVDFINSHNRLPVPSETFNNIKIGLWCKEQAKRQLYGNLENYKIDKLNQLKTN